jgi:hypothetical protein
MNTAVDFIIKYLTEIEPGQADVLALGQPKTLFPKKYRIAVRASIINDHKMTFFGRDPDQIFLLFLQAHVNLCGEELARSLGKGSFSSHQNFPGRSGKKFNLVVTTSTQTTVRMGKDAMKAYSEHLHV